MAGGNGGRGKVGNDSDVKQIDVAQLLAGRPEVFIIHNGERYRLRITSKGKLILTK